MEPCGRQRREFTANSSVFLILAEARGCPRMSDWRLRSESNTWINLEYFKPFAQFGPYRYPE